MNKLLPVLVFLATASAFSQGSMAVELPLAAVFPAPAMPSCSSAAWAAAPRADGGMGGMTGGGMGGMTGGGMTAEWVECPAA